MFEIYRRAGRMAVEEETEKESTNSFTTTIREIRQETRSSLRFLLRPSFFRLIIKVRGTIHAKEIFRTNGQRTWLKESRTDDTCSMLLITKERNFSVCFFEQRYPCLHYIMKFSLYGTNVVLIEQLWLKPTVMIFFHRTS